LLFLSGFILALVTSKKILSFSAIFWEKISNFFVKKNFFCSKNVKNSQKNGSEKQANFDHKIWYFFEDDYDFGLDFWCQKISIFSWKSHNKVKKSPLKPSVMALISGPKSPIKTSFVALISGKSFFCSLACFWIWKPGPTRFWVLFLMKNFFKIFVKIPQKSQKSTIKPSVLALIFDPKSPIKASFLASISGKRFCCSLAWFWIWKPEPTIALGFGSYLWWKKFSKFSWISDNKVKKMTKTFSFGPYFWPRNLEKNSCSLA